ncbi:MAG: NAD(P)/FAD-dependent oxidoreductase, partial [Methanobrevibacter sp.]|nr:NAD(P)/FAD-dependent oxidoreductase [Methanobrevibacter sp.]
SEVNVIVRSEFLKELDSDTKDYVIKHVLPDMNILENTDVEECGKNKVITKNGDELEGIPFFATGRVPNSEIAEGFVDLNPDNTIKVNEFMQTSRDNVYAAGDVTGGWQLTPVARMEGICAARNIAGYLNKVSYNSIPQTISLNTEVSFAENEKIGDVETETIAIPGIAGPGAFWKILSGNTGYSKIEFDKQNNKIKKINSISPSSTSDVAYLSYLMRIDSPLDEYSNFLEIHPSTDTNYKIIKNLWL